MFKQQLVRVACCVGICTAIGLSVFGSPQASAATKLVIGTAVYPASTSKAAVQVASAAKTEAAAASSRVEKLIAIGKNYLGVKYQFGAKPGSTHAFDCSSYTQYIFKQIGISLPRTSAAQAKIGSKVAKANLKPGDLVFFKRPGVSGIGHVAVYIGNNQMLGASGDKVQISSMNSNYWKRNYVTARRVL